MRKRLFLWGILIIPSITILVLGARYLATKYLPLDLYTYLAIFLGTASAIFGFLANIPGFRDFINSINGKLKQPTLTPKLIKRNREKILKKVYEVWIDGVLDASLQDTKLLTLDYEEVPGMLKNAWGDLLTLPSSNNNKILPEKDGVSLYERFHGSFLILGGPGSGKTTTLLELTRILINIAEKDNEYRIPIVFNLSAWGLNRGKIRDWLINEAHSRYQVPPLVSSSWIDDDELILLLDGLDEVKEEFQNECVDRINEFILSNPNHLAPNIIITSRIKDYEKLKSKLNLTGAVIQQPLSAVQINDYFMYLGSNFKIVLDEIKKEAVLSEFEKSPLGLNLIAITYKRIGITGFQSGTENERNDQLCQAYIDEMFDHRKIREKYTKQQIINGLSWLAKYMKDRSKTNFSIEEMQPDSLSDIKMRKVFFISTNLILWFLIAPFFGVACGINTFYLTHSVLHGIINLILFGLTSGLGIWLATRGFFSLYYRLFIGCLTGLSFSSLVFIFNKNVVICILVFIVVSLGITRLFKRINLQITDQLSKIEIRDFNWSISSGIVGFYKRLPIGIILGLIFGLATISQVGWLKGMLIGLCLMVMIGIVGGLSYGNVDVEIGDSQKPNEAVWRIFKNAFRLAFGCGISAGIIMGFILYTLTNNFHVGLIAGISFSLAGFTGGWITGGGYPSIQHLVLRILLKIKENVPLKYPEFLRRCVYHILLLQAGGSFIFKHGFILDYLAKNAISNKHSKTT